MNNIEIEIFILDKSYEEASNIASSYGFYLRRVWEDGKSYVVTCDWDENRIDVYIQNGIIANPQKLYDAGIL